MAANIEMRVPGVRAVNLFYMLVFCYFLTLSADLLNIEIALFKIKVNNFLAVVLCGSLSVTRQGLYFPKDMRLPAGMIFVSLFVSSLGSVYWQRCMGYCAVYLFDCAVYFLVPYSLFFHFDREKMLRLYFSSFIVIGIYAFAQLLLSIGGIYTPLLRQWIETGGWARPHGLSYEPSFYALYMCAFVMSYNALYLFDQQKRSMAKLICVNALLLVSTATSGFFAYFFFIPIALLFARYGVNFKRKLWKLVASVTGFLLFVAAVAPKIVVFFVKFFIVGFFAHHSFAERWEAIVNAWSVFLEHPFLGVGIGGIGPYLYYREKVGMQPGGSFGMSLQEVEIFDPTNVTTEVLAGLGILGVIAFAVLFVWVFKRFKEVFLLPEKERGRALSLFIGLFVILLVLQFNPGLFRCYIWVHMAVALGYARSLSLKSPL